MEEELNLKEFLKGILKRKKIIIVTTIIFLIIGLLNSTDTIELPLVKKEEEKIDEIYAKTTFMVLQKEEYVIDDTAVNGFLRLLTSNRIMNAAIEKFELDITAEELKESVKVDRLAYTEVIRIGIANEELKEVSLELLQYFLDVMDTELKNIYQVSGIYMLDLPMMLELEDVSEDQVDVQPQKETKFSVKNVVVITLAGFVLGAVIVIGLEFVDGSIKNKDQIINQLELENLGVLDVKNINDEECYREIKLNMVSNKVVLISELVNNPTNEIVTKISELYSKYGKKVATIDISEDSLKVYDQLGKEVKNADKNLVELLETEKMVSFIENLQDKYDFILVKGKNIFTSINTLAMSKFVDGVVCVVQERKTKLKVLSEVKRNLLKIDSKIIGTIIVKK